MVNHARPAGRRAHRDRQLHAALGPWRNAGTPAMVVNTVLPFLAVFDLTEYTVYGIVAIPGSEFAEDPLFGVAVPAAAVLGEPGAAATLLDRLPALPGAFVPRAPALQIRVRELRAHGGPDGEGVGWRTRVGRHRRGRNPPGL